MDENNKIAIGKLREYSKNHMGENGFFRWDEATEAFLKEKCQISDPYDWINELIGKGLLSEPFLGKLKFVGGDSMPEENTKKEEKKEKEGQEPSEAKGTAPNSGAQGAGEEKAGIDASENQPAPSGAPEPEKKEVAQPGTTEKPTGDATTPEQQPTGEAPTSKEEPAAPASDAAPSPQPQEQEPEPGSVGGALPKVPQAPQGTGDIVDISDIIPSGEGYGYPKIDVFLDGERKKEGILTQAQILAGDFGESCTLYIDTVWYHCSSPVVLRQIKLIIDRGIFPIRVRVASVDSKKTPGYTYYTLAG